MRKVVYLGLDAHVRSCVLAGMDSRGKLLFNERFSTSESALTQLRHFGYCDIFCTTDKRM